MQPILFTLGVFGIIGLTALIHAAYTAPEAIEDETGFHPLKPADPARHVYTPSSILLGEGDALFFR